MTRKTQIAITLLIDVMIFSLALLNITSMSERAEVPQNLYSRIKNTSQNNDSSHAIVTLLEIDGKEIKSYAFQQYFLSQYKKGDYAKIKYKKNNTTYEETVRLEAKYPDSRLLAVIVVGFVYFFTALYLILKFFSSNYSKIVHWLAICTMIMIMFDWGTIQKYGILLNGLLWILYDWAMFLMPALFLHFSFVFPQKKMKRKKLLLSVFYSISTIGMLISVVYVILIFFLSYDIYSTYYIEVHSIILDIFIITGLIATIGNFEHSVLNMENALDRNKIYWILLGIFFGPLVYTFLRLIPRIMLGEELVSETIMLYTVMLAPIMLIIAIKKKK